MAVFSDISKNLAEELVFLRAQIASLKARESEVRKALILTTPTKPGKTEVKCESSNVVVDRKETWRFDSKKLPQSIRNDRAYQTLKITTTVRVVKSQAPVRQTAQPLPKVPKPALKELGDFEVIERYFD